ncbi:uncharacterized protein LOC117119598 isoform X3 [Anneissia japonica]|uniref:uncharacterized protein LOC117119598 isoform X1 n=1 Tax=Anneissia japonica TaxID=1529436 RepID=UPI0014255BBB|nr:uncharacterized protein LOC117119598 isoform X1 [Anneissia japonica]XP_033120321.1 uncharacterized protein LOC117119598 isoform X2 [Anneissia japonica]XP_033120322.1 uncharacterized protein LOC117119598 isoform X2 [Anneissia japonica]XP_033120323.1 uncharacterized protein LOC117119598 isoform X3 [Anneissia japonica]
MANPHGTETALVRALLDKNWPLVSNMLAKDSQLVNECPDGKSTLCCAVKEAPEELLLKMLEAASKETINILDDDGRSLLHLCALRSFDKCIKFILKKSDLHINLQDGWVSRTPLQICARSDATFRQQLHIVVELICNGADISLRDEEGRTAADLYVFNDCMKYDNSSRKQEKKQILHILKGEVPRQILVSGYNAVKIYLKALEQGGVQYQRCSLTVVGQARAGKTSLIKKFTGQRFNSKEKETDGIVTTVLCDINETDGQWKLDTSKEIGSTITEGLSLKIYDFAGQEIYYATHQLFLISQAVFLLVFDLSLDLNAKAMAGKHSHAKNFPSWMVMKVATFLGHKKNVKVYEITNLDFIIIWLSSIYAHTVENKRTDGAEARQLSPPVFITGTHENNLPGNKSQRNAKAEQIFETIRKAIQHHPCLKHVVTRYYAVDSSLRNDEEILKLQKHILEVVREEPYMSNLIPVTWLDLELTLEEKRKDMYMIKMADVRSVAAKCGVNDSEELSTFLQFQHNTGNCVYFENKMNVDDPLNHYVILNQRWLNDIFIGVITIRPAREQFAQFSDSWDRLAKYGLLDEKLARHVWRGYDIDPNLVFNLMSRFDLLCEMQFSAEEAARRLAEKSRVFCLPCCLSETIEAPAVVEDDNRTVRFFVDFDGFLPGGLFFRLMVRTIRFSQDHGSTDQRLSRHSAEFYVDQDHNLILRIYSKNRSFMEVIIVRVSGDDTNPSPTVCQMVYKFLFSALTDLCNIWSKGVKFTFGVPCDQCQDEPPHLHAFDECTQKSKVACKGLRMDTTGFQSLFVQENQQKETSTTSDMNVATREAGKDNVCMVNNMVIQSSQGSFTGSQISDSNIGTVIIVNNTLEVSSAQGNQNPAELLASLSNAHIEENLGGTETSVADQGGVLEGSGEPPL